MVDASDKTEIATEILLYMGGSGVKVIIQVRILSWLLKHNVGFPGGSGVNHDKQATRI